MKHRRGSEVAKNCFSQTLGDNFLPELQKLSMFNTSKPIKIRQTSSTMSRISFRKHVSGEREDGIAMAPQALHRNQLAPAGTGHRRRQVRAVPVQ